jgi:DNA gyrase subunit A
MAIRFSEANARSMGRTARGVKGIKLGKGDEIVGMLVADPEGQLLTVTENGYGKRTPFGPNSPDSGEASGDSDDSVLEESPTTRDAEGPPSEITEESSLESDPSSMRYRIQRRGGKGLKDVKVTSKNGPVVGIASVRDGDEIMLITKDGMVTRSKVDDIRIVGRNTQGVRVMNLNEGDRLVTVAKVASETVGEPPEPKV